MNQNPFDKRSKASPNVRVVVQRAHWAKVYGQVRQVFDGWVVDMPTMEASEGFELGRVRVHEPTDPAPITLDEIHAFMQKRNDEAEANARRNRALDRARKMEAEDALLAKHGLLEEASPPRRRGKQEATA